MKFLIGIDDTDNLESRGTGHRVRMLADWLAENKLAAPLGITRHQLLVDPQIPYTSHNSSACLSVDTDNADDVWEASREFLLRESAVGSDAGLCLVTWDEVPPCVRAFGVRAKQVVLTQLEAEQTALDNGIRLEGLTGTGGGIIGALAAVGLRHIGEDGRFLWLPGLRELQGKLSVAQICSQGHVDRICTVEEFDLSSEILVDVGEWVRPVLRGGQATLYVEELNHEWHIISKDRIKSLSN
ncbi:MAG: ABC transporter substrate-binding protein [Chloroflexi bacterium]|nr:ABC transporter substrate-binding protein [Chloroflexota bacterium]